MRERLAENLADWWRGHRGLPVSLPPTFRNKTIIHETVMKSNRLLYLVVIRMALRKEYVPEDASGA
jgi:hypothetical protein